MPSTRKHLNRHVAFFGLAILALGVAACGPRDHFAKGKSLMDRREFSRAIIEFKTALHANPKNADAYYELGLAFEATHDFQSAADAYKVATQLDPKHKNAQVRLAELMAVAGDASVLKEAKGRLQSVLDGKTDSAEAVDTLALTELRLGETDLAIQDLEPAIGRFPSDRTSAILLAYADAQKNDFQAAEAVLRKACVDQPKSAPIRIALGRFLYHRNRPADAEAAFQDALRVDPKNEPALLDLAMLQSAQGHDADAENTFRKLANLNDVHYRADYGVYLFGKGRRQDAIREFERIYAANPSDRDTRTRLIAAYELSGRQADAGKLLATALEKNPKDSDALLSRGELLLNAGRYNEAERNLNQVLRFNPNLAEVHYALAHLHLARNESATYRQELAEALRLQPAALRMRLELAEALSAAKDFNASLATLDQAPATEKNQPSLLARRNWTLWASGDLAGMRKGVDALLAQERSAEGLLQDGVLKLKTDNLQGARASLEESLAKDPSNVRAINALNQTWLAQKQPSVGISKVKEYAARAPDAPQMQEFLGQALRTSGDWNGARAAFLKAKAADPGFAEADMSLVQADAHEHKWDDAKNRLKTMLVRNPADTSARLALANIEEAMGDPHAALGEYRRIVQDEPDNAQALNNLAYALSEQEHQQDEALKYAQKAHELAPADSAIEDTLGWVLYRKGLYTMAVRYLEETNDRGPSAVVRYHLAMAYARAGNPDRGRTMFQTALKLNPNVPEAKMAEQIFTAR
jgi:tetratricopeptide (TPR) repeat protein